MFIRGILQKRVYIREIKIFVEGVVQLFY